AVDDLPPDPAPPPEVSPAPAAPSPAPSDATPPAPNVAADGPPAAPRLATDSIGAALWAAPSLSIGGAPPAATRARLEAEPPYRRVSVGLDLRLDLPASKRVDGGGTVSTWLALASIVPCVRAPAPLFFCGVASLGGFQESGAGVSHPHSDSALFVAT